MHCSTKSGLDILCVRMSCRVMVLPLPMPSIGHTPPREMKGFWSSRIMQQQHTVLYNTLLYIQPGLQRIVLPAIPGVDALPSICCAVFSALLALFLPDLGGM